MPAASLTRGGGLVAPALTLLNLAGYVLAVVASRVLSPGDYGALTSLLGVLLVASVPALALQAVVARSVARRPAGEAAGPRERALLGRCALVGALVTAVVAALAPLLASFLRVDVAGPLWLAAGLLPLAVLSAVLGVLQGREHFGALAGTIVVQGVAKLVALVPLALGGGPAGVLAGYSAGTALAAVVGLVLLQVGPGRGDVEGLPAPRELLLAGGSLLALLALANLDLLLARNALPADASGRYAVGSVLSKAAFWLPQTVAVVVLPRLTDAAGGRDVLRRSVLLVAGLGLLEVLGCLVLGGPVIALTFGEQYRSLAGVAPLFVVQGATLAVVQLLVYRGIALHSAAVGRLVVGALAAEAAVVLVLRPTTAAEVLLPAVVVALLLAVSALVLEPGRLSRSAPGSSGRP